MKEGCCGLTKEHVEAIIYWMVTCCRRRSAGRAEISYRAYKPLRNNVDDEEMGETGDNNEEQSGEEGAAKPKKQSRMRAAASAAASAASAVASAPRVVFNMVRNNLTIQQEKKEQQLKMQGGNVRTKREARLAMRQHKDDLIDESDGDYDNMGWGVADREHEKGTWISATVSSSMHGAQRS